MRWEGENNMVWIVMVMEVRGVIDRDGGRMGRWVRSEEIKRRWG